MTSGAMQQQQSFKVTRQLMQIIQMSRKTFIAHFCGFRFLSCTCSKLFWNQNFAANTSFRAELSFAGPPIQLRPVKEEFIIEISFEVLFLPQ